MHNKMRFGAPFAAVVMLLSACSAFDEAKPEDAIAAGERISVLDTSSALEADETTQDEHITIPAFSENKDWPQIGGGLVNNQGNYAIRSVEVSESTSVGEGNDWNSSLVAAPIIANNRVYAMDGAGYISAHNVEDIDEVAWIADALVEKDERAMIGGGLAYADGIIYASSGFGRIVALSEKDGSKLWQVSQGVPIRAAPRLVNGWLLAITVDNQTLAINAKSGKIVWSHRGISETAGFLSSIAPAVEGEMLIVPYSSGELIALDIATGQQRWMDMLTSNRKTNALSRFNGITALPIVHDGAVFSLHASGLLVAHRADNGAVLWEREMDAHHAPWVIGDYMVLITRQDQLVFLRHKDGQIVWVSPLMREYEEEKWLDPIVAGNHIMVMSSEGSAWVHSPVDGAASVQYDIPDDVAVAPVVAEGRIFLFTRDATLHGLY